MKEPKVSFLASCQYRLLTAYLKMDHSPSKRGSQGLINCLRFLVWLWGRKFGWEWRRKAQIFEVDGIFSLWVRKKLLNIHLAEPRSMVPQKFANYLHELPSLPFFSSKHPSSSFNRVCAIWNTTGVQWCLLREEERGDQQKKSWPRSDDLCWRWQMGGL